MKQHNLIKTLSLRLKSDTHRAFVKKANKVGRPSEVMRDLIVAYIENRVTVTPKEIT